MENYVRTLFAHELPTCTVEEADDAIVTIRTPQGDTKAVSNFMMRFSIMPGEQGHIMSEFAAQVRDRQRFLVTFSQEEAERNRRVTYLNIYHPLVVAAKECFLKSYRPAEQTFRFHIHRSAEDANMPAEGYYTLSLYNITTEQTRYGTTRTIQEILPVLYNIEDGEVVTDEEPVEALRRAVQNDGKAWPAEDRFAFDRDQVADMRVSVKEYVSDSCKQKQQETSIRQNSDVQNQRYFLAQRYDMQIKQLEDQIEQYEAEIDACKWGIWVDESGKGTSLEKHMSDLQRVLPAIRAQLQHRIDERDAKLKELDDVPQPIVSSKLMMINLIHIV